MKTYFNFPEKKVIVIDGNNCEIFSMDEYEKQFKSWEELKQKLGGNKMVKLSEVVKNERAFPEAQEVKGEDVLDLEMSIKAIAKRKGKDGDFLVILADIGKDSDVSFTNGAKAVVETLLKAVEELGVIWNDDIATFDKALETKMVEKKSASGRVYYVLE